MKSYVVIGRTVYKGKELEFKEPLPYYMESQAETLIESAKRRIRIRYHSEYPYSKARLSYSFVKNEGIVEPEKAEKKSILKTIGSKMAQIRKPKPTVTKEDLEAVRKTQQLEKPHFNFSKNWNELDDKTAHDFAQKCEFITDRSLEIISKKHNVPYSELVGAVYLDCEQEWDATDKVVSDEDWIDATVKNFEDCLKDEGYI